MAGLALVAAAAGWSGLRGGTPWIWPVVLATSVAGIVGLARWLAWGRGILDAFSVLAAMAMACICVSAFAPDDDLAGPTPLDHWSVPAAWLLAVALGTAPMLPAVVLGWRRAWFRSAWW
ncbi:MAG TPA: hypothetical protein VF457_03820 [Burkholderiaceae bacterium]